MKLFKISYNRPYLTIVIDYRELEKILGSKYFEKRVSLIKSRVAEAVEKNGGLVKSIWKSIYYTKVIARVPPAVYGYVVRELSELEDKIIKRYSPYRHFVVLYYSDKPFVPRVAVYRASSEGYRTLSRLCWKLLETGIYAERIGLNRIGIVVGEGVEPREEFTIVAGNETTALKYLDSFILDYSEKAHREFAKRLIDRVVKREYLAKGYRVRGRHVFEKPAVYGFVSVARGVEFQSFVMEDGYIALTFAPRHELASTVSLAEENLESFVGLRVKRIVDEKTGIVAKERSEKASDSLSELGGKSLLEVYRNMGIEADPSEPVLEVSIRGAISLELPSGLKRVVDLREAAKMGVPKEVLRDLHVRPERYKSYVEEFLKPVNPIEVAGETIRFIEHAPTL
ncbi:MAG: hypothetical protein DRN04_14795 [Thermoprotei archaeon]|nr:MAG: hypothetical protein DRN04_14795 [Thermoprotei archaeon]